MVLVAVYFVCGLVGSEITFMSGKLTLVWPQAAIALAALLLFGKQYWPGVAAGAIVFSLMNGRDVGYFTLGTMVGNTVGALVCVHLLEKLAGFQKPMERVRDVAAFVGLTCLVGATMNAACSAVGLIYDGAADWDDLYSTVLSWWIPNMMAGLIITPFFLAWVSPARTIEWRSPRMVEFLLWAGGLAGTVSFSFHSWFGYGIENYPLAYLPYPFLVWGSLRFGQRGATLSTLVLSAVAIYSLQQGRGPFVSANEKESLLIIGCYLGILAISNLLLAATVLERRQAECAVEESEKRYRTVVEDQKDLIWRFTSEGIITFVNGAYCRFYEKSREELMGSNFLTMLAPEDREIPLQYFQTLTPEHPTVSYDQKVHLSDHKFIWQQFTIRRLFGPVADATEFQAVVQDVTRYKEVEEKIRKLNEELELRAREIERVNEDLRKQIQERRQVEDQLRQSQKLEAIGQLAGGVAHDFNNLLTIILGNAQLMTTKGRAVTVNAESLDQITRAAERAANLTRQLLTFSRRQVMALELVDLCEVVSNLSKMLNRILGEDISMQLRLPAGLPRIQADAGMIEQVLLNLAVNSRDAMPKGGVLTIEVSLQKITDAPLPPSANAIPGDYLCLRVTDTGCGIAPEHLPHVFEPFFTTKDVGKGTGLGLATAYGIVQQHKGWVLVTTKMGQGSTFEVFLPALDQSVPSTSKPAVAQRTPGGTETVLVVEDDDGVRTLVQGVLEDCGYKVFTAAHGQQAMELWRQNRDQIHLLFTDIVMPGGINGKDLANLFKADRPRLKIILSSGYNQKLQGEDLQASEGKYYLAKPYNPSRLVAMVRDCLDSP